MENGAIGQLGGIVPLRVAMKGFDVAREHASTSTTTLEDLRV